MVIDAITNKLNVGIQLKDIIRDIQFLLQRFINVNISHIYHEGNSVADACAELGQRYSNWRVWRQSDFLPLNIKNIILKDMAGS